MTSSDASPRSPPPPSSPAHRRNSSPPQRSPEKENQVPRSSRPLTAPKPVPASTFYGTSSTPSKNQPSKAGSAHTAYAEASGATTTKDAAPFREPELIQEEPIPPYNADPWAPQTSEFPVSTEGWGPAVDTPWDPSWGPSKWDTNPSRNVDIDGRSDEEELNWADKELRAKMKRPGPGLLPPLLTQVLHNPDHTLYTVTAAVPDSVLSHTRSTSAASSSTSPPQASSVHPPTPPPTAEEVRTAIPHPNAYYCKEHNGWVLLLWKSSPQLPVIHPSYKPTQPFPDQSRRRKMATCVPQDEQHPIWPTNKTHHFHKYERAVAARDLVTPYNRSEWEEETRRKQKRRKMTIHLDDDGSTTTTTEEPPQEPEAEMLDLYLCCQCSTYCLVSEVLPGVIPLRMQDEFNKDKLAHPTLGRTPEVSLVTGWETVITYVPEIDPVHASC